MSFVGRWARKWRRREGYGRHRGDALLLAQEQMDGGAPRQEICDLLLSRAPQGRSRQAYAELASQLQAVMLDRNRRATQLEQAGDGPRAVDLYEANVADRFLGELPYERLLDIYARRGDWRNAARVAEAYLGTMARTSDPARRRADLERRLGEWRQRLDTETRGR